MWHNDLHAESDSAIFLSQAWRVCTPPRTDRMNAQEQKEKMTFRKAGEVVEPIFTSLINGSFIIAAYPGHISAYDILIRYRQKQETGWSRMRTPKHIHWAVDVLIKMQADETQTRAFLGELLDLWKNTKPLTSERDRSALLSTHALLEQCCSDFKRYEALGRKGEYSINFLILLAKLLMVQEKTNMEKAYMFENLLQALKQGDDLFKIVSIATHGGRR